MKLTNPTNDQLNAAFAEKVAGRTPSPLNQGLFRTADDNGGWYDEQPARYTTSADAVLPWLEKWRTIAIDWDRIAEMWSVGIGQYKDDPGRDNSLSRACVIALLRAHGVEVEFTAPSSPPPPADASSPSASSGQPPASAGQ